MITRHDLLARTDPIAAAGNRPLVARVNDPTLLDGAAGLLAFVLDYLRDSGAEISDGDTLQYGYWSVRFTPSPDALELWERDDAYAGYVRGVDRAVRFWTAQWEACVERGSGFDPPRADGLAVAAKDIFSAPRLNAIRYEARPHTTGWWFLTESFTGDPEQLAPQHLHHLTARYPALAPYLALDVGWVVHADGEHVKTYWDPTEDGAG